MSIDEAIAEVARTRAQVAEALGHMQVAMKAHHAAEDSFHAAQRTLSEAVNRAIAEHSV